MGSGSLRQFMQGSHGVSIQQVAELCLNLVLQTIYIHWS